MTAPVLILWSKNDTRLEVDLGRDLEKRLRAAGKRVEMIVYPPYSQNGHFMKWAQTFGENDPDKVVLLYATDGVLWGTLSPTVRADRAALRDYFVTAFKFLPGLKVTFGEQLIRVYGGTAVNTGYYTFSWVKDGETKTLPARYSFTFVRDGENWMIVDHHSSAMPAPPPR